MVSKFDDFVLNALFAYYDSHARELPWRVAEPDGTYDPYKILVSELMLQQTQVPRVIPKYLALLGRFPTIGTLADADFSEVLGLWLGLGYNRRAKYLYEAAVHLRSQSFPQSISELTQLHGIGQNTAAAILTYVFNQPHEFIETNIRTVLLHHYYADEQRTIDDDELRTCLRRLLATQKRSYREFYWAMMDYGTFLKSDGSKAHRKSGHYKKQSSFVGSKRQLRGAILRAAQARMSVSALKRQLQDERMDEIIKELTSESLIRVHKGRLELNNIRT